MNTLKPTYAQSTLKCEKCSKIIADEGQFCGRCGHSTQQVATDNSENATLENNLQVKSPWQRISNAIRLWVFLLALNGIFGLIAHFKDISSPLFDLCAQSISAIIIILACIEGRKEIRPFLSSFGVKKYYHLVEVTGAFLCITVFMWLYIKGISFIGFSTLNYLTDYQQHNWPIWSAFILISLCPAIFEELAFRGYIMNKLEMVGSTQEALVIQAAMFSVLHMFPASFISHFILGLVLGAIRISSKSLYPSMFLHAAWNAFVITKELFLA